MKTLRLHEDGLKIDDVQILAPGPKDVLIKVHAAAITADELTLPETKERKYPIPGHDIAGVVEAKGQDVGDAFPEGSKVFALTSFSRDCGAAEYLVASYKEIAHMPSNLTFEEAAAIPLSALWVYQAIYQHLHPKSGENVLVVGAGDLGGVGVMAVQIARSAGLIVSATCSTDKVDLVKSLGASQVFDYHRTNLSDISHDQAYVIDCVGGTTLPQCFPLLKGGGKLISVARPTTAEEKASRPDVDASFFIVGPDGDELAEIARMCEEGKIKPVLSTVIPLEQGAKAFEELNGHTRGKVVMKVA